MVLYIFSIKGRMSKHGAENKRKLAYYGDISTIKNTLDGLTDFYKFSSKDVIIYRLEIEG